MSIRGGMCSSPFGRRTVNGISVSNPRLDKVDIASMIMNGDTPPEFAMFAETLIKAVHNYLYWGLGKNGCTDVKWQDAFDYLFKIRSDDPSTWGEREVRYIEEKPDGTRVTHVDTLSDEELRMRCFDVHYRLINLDRSMPFSSFLRILLERRQQILRENREQIEAFFERERQHEFCRIPRGSRMMFSFKEHDFIKTLAYPASTQQLEEVVMFPLQTVMPRRIRARSSL